MVCWRGSDELLVTQEASGGDPFKPKLGVFAITADGKSRRLILSKAWNPLASPDGNLIAFYGPESPRQKPSRYWTKAPLDQSLCIARSDGKPMRNSKTGYVDRLPLDRFGAAYPALFWSRDSKSLYAAVVTNNSIEPFVIIWRFDVKSGERHLVAVWDFQIPNPAASNDFSSYRWSFSGLSGDGKTLFATFHQDHFLSPTYQWFAVDLTKGTLAKLATLRGTDFAWHSH
jgi:hypothetical protein